MIDEPRLSSCYIIGGPMNGHKIVDIGTGTQYEGVEPDEKFDYFYEYDAEKSTLDNIRYRYVQPNTVAAILNRGKAARSD